MKKILIVTHNVCYPMTNGDSVRIYRLVEHLLEKGHEVKVLTNPLDGKDKNEDPEWLIRNKDFTNDFKVKTKHSNSKINNLQSWFCQNNFVKFYEDYLNFYEPTEIIFIYGFFQPLLSVTPKHIKTFVDVPILHSAREAKDPLGFSFEDEIKLYEDFDYIMNSSSVGVEAFIKYENNLYCGINMPIEKLQLTNKKSVIMFGGIRPDSIRAIDTMVKDIWPKVIKEEPDAILNIYGNFGYTQEIPNNINIKGFYPAKQALQENTIFVDLEQPTGGVKVKTLEAASHGLAIITNNHNDPAGVYRNIEGVAEDIIDIIRDEAYFEHLQNRSIKHVEENNKKAYEELDKLL